MCDAPLAPPPPPPAVDLKAANRAAPAQQSQPQPPPPAQDAVKPAHSPQRQSPHKPPQPHSNGTGDSPETPPLSLSGDPPRPAAAASADAVDDAPERRDGDEAAKEPEVGAPPAPAADLEPAEPEAAREPAPLEPPPPAVAPDSRPNGVEEPKAEPDLPTPPPKAEPEPPAAPIETPTQAEELSAPISEKTEPATAPVQKKTEIKPKSTLKLATVAPAMSRKRKKEPKLTDGPGPAKKIKEDAAEDSTDAERPATPDSRSGKRNRTKVQPYQSPTPELAIVTKLSVGSSRGSSTPAKQNVDDKLIVFYKNEFLAVRNAEGSFYVCQTMQNVYRTTRKIKIRWLSQEKTGDPSGEIYKPDFYDVTDIECVLTTLSLQRAGSAGLRLGAAELARTQSILGRALAAERGEPAPDTSVTEEHPDGLDLSLYKDESQLEKKGGRSSRKRTHSKSSPADRSDTTDDSVDDIKSTPKRRSALSPKKSKTKTPKSKSASKTKSKKKSPSKDKHNNTSSQPPISAPTTNKTATTPGKTVSKAKKSLVTPKPASKTSPGLRRNTPKSSSAKAAAAKAAQLASTPSTSTGKSTRTPRKPPSKK